MTVFFAILLTILAFAFIIYPFFRQRPHSVDSTEGDELQELHARRDTTYSMLKELEFDFQSGILSEEDYRDLQARYKGKAVSILKDMDGLKESPQNIEDEIESHVLKLRQVKKQFCPQCGARYQAGDRFCSQCGAKLS